MLAPAREGQAEALTGVDAVADASSCSATDHDEAVAFFSRSTRNLLEAERRSGVRHQVLLSIAGLTKVTGNAHYAGRRAQEELVERSPVRLSFRPHDGRGDSTADAPGDVWERAPVPLS